MSQGDQSFDPALIRDCSRWDKFNGGYFFLWGKVWTYRGKEGTSRLLPPLTQINTARAICLTWCSWDCRVSTCMPLGPAPLTHPRKKQEFIKRWTAGYSCYQYRNSWIKMGSHGPLAPRYMLGESNHFLFWCSPVVRKELHPNRKSWLWKTVLPLRAGSLTHSQRGAKRTLIED